MKTISREDFAKKSADIVKEVSKWLTENVDTTRDFKYHEFGLHIWSDLGGYSPVRIVVTDNCGAVNGGFISDPYRRCRSVDDWDLAENPPRGSACAIDECAISLVQHWENIKMAVENHNEKIAKVIMWNGLK